MEIRNIKSPITELQQSSNVNKSEQAMQTQHVNQYNQMISEEIVPKETDKVSNISDLSGIHLDAAVVQHDKTNRSMVEIVNTDKSEVLYSFPSEEVLNGAAYRQELIDDVHIVEKKI